MNIFVKVLLLTLMHVGLFEMFHFLPVSVWILAFFSVIVAYAGVRLFMSGSVSPHLSWRDALLVVLVGSIFGVLYGLRVVWGNVLFSVLLVIVGFILMILLLYILYGNWLSIVSTENRSADRVVFVVLYLCMFIFSISIISIVDFEWLRHAMSISFALLYGTLLSVIGRKDVGGLMSERGNLLLNSLLSFLILLFGATFFHSLKAYILVRSVWWAIVLGMAHALVFVLYALSYAIPIKRLLISVFLMFIVSFQLFWVLEFLPFGAFVLGIIHVLPLWLLYVVERDRLLDELRPQRYARLGLIFSIFIIAIFFLARWS